MAFEEVLYTVSDHIALVTLNRPDRLNAWTPNMAGEVRAAMDAAAGDDEVRVVVLTGAGRGFCSGADMAELQTAAEHGPTAVPQAIIGEQADYAGYPTMRSDFLKRYSYFPSIPKPVIAAVNGPAAGLGLLLTLFCDLRFASEKARFTTAFAHRGLIAEYGLAWILPRIVGLPDALDLLLSARVVDAREALGMGLVQRVFPEEGMMEGVKAYAAELAASVSPRSMAVVKRQVYEGQLQGLAEAIGLADREMLLSIESADFRGGTGPLHGKAASAVYREIASLRRGSPHPHGTIVLLITSPCECVRSGANVRRTFWKTGIIHPKNYQGLRLEIFLLRDLGHGRIWMWPNDTSRSRGGLWVTLRREHGPEACGRNIPGTHCQRDILAVPALWKPGV